MENILITGVTGGIGRACAEKLLKGGNSVIGLGRDTDRLESEWSAAYPGKFHAVNCDLMETWQIKETLEEIVSSYGAVGGFIQCAGFDKMAPIHMTKIEDFERLWRIHALVPMHMISILCRKKFHSEGMSIVLITSQSAHEGAMGHTAYASAKGALEGYLSPAAAELMEKGIRINEVCLGPIQTRMAKGWMEKLKPDGQKKLIDSYPLGLGEVRDAANLICFLLSEESRYINGQMITADGGHAVRKV